MARTSDGLLSSPDSGARLRMKTNHRRGFKANTQRYKGGTQFRQDAPLSGISVSAQADWDFTNGNRGMAKSVRGAKKFVSSRVRHHENAATRRIAGEGDATED
jgi:hypothetical protein